MSQSHPFFKVKKAVITAAGKGTRHFPSTLAVQKELFPVVSPDGISRPVLHLVVLEALQSGIEEIGIVVSPSSEGPIRSYFRGVNEKGLEVLQGKEWTLEEARRLQEACQRITLIRQDQQLGYGHAIFCARDFVGNDPFLVMLGDHLYLSETEVPCPRQLIQIFEAYQRPLFGVQLTPEDQLYLFGTIKGEPLPGTPPAWRVLKVVEKPSVEYARKYLRTPGLPEGYYFCFLGMHIFTPSLFHYLERLIREDRRSNGEYQLTDAQALMVEEEEVIAAGVRGQRLDMGIPEGYLETFIALGLRSPFKERILKMIREAKGAGSSHRF